MNNKNKLLQKYEAVRKLCQELPNSYKKDLNSVFGRKYYTNSCRHTFADIIWFV